ncbi:MAG: hypothetical protein AAF317_00220 [Pseudomonadota bacterium]
MIERRENDWQGEGRVTPTSTEQIALTAMLGETGLTCAIDLESLIERLTVERCVK